MSTTPSNWTSELTGVFADGHGGMVDWSGITAVGVCLECKDQIGPYFTEWDAHRGLSKHRKEAHPEGVDPELVKAQREALCSAEGCEKVPHSKGMCSKHKEQALADHRKVYGPWCEWEHGLCGEGARMAGYCHAHYSRHKAHRTTGNPLNTQPLGYRKDRKAKGFTEPARIKGVRLKDTHGTYNCYAAGCRCEQCADAQHAYYMDRRAKAGTTVKPMPKTPRHGTMHTYRAHGCRCDECVTVMRDYYREYRRANKQVKK